MLQAPLFICSENRFALFLDGEPELRCSSIRMGEKSFLIEFYEVHDGSVEKRLKGFTKSVDMKIETYHPEGDFKKIDVHTMVELVEVYPSPAYDYEGARISKILALFEITS